ncbi:phage protein Gp36 family protein [Chryseobacterium sp.]|uniref:phage protein Gp36 family protein n=1 Tax=Chryseobacterium sp. TaxID=1871047 RepID=UPI00289A411F|nr:phage protein Gp36 family protein [Chryseobacterium sp.]
MFLEVTDIGTTIYNYQFEQISDGDENIIIQAMASAEEEMRSYLSGNSKKEWSDGRPKYDVEAIFTATGNERNALLVRHGCTLTKWYIVELCNADILYETAKERYDRAITWLKALSKGEINLSTLPTIADPEAEENETSPFVYGSREKFTHE